MNSLFLSITWDASPEMFSIGSVTLRYYGFLFVTGFIIGFFILKKHFKAEGKSPDEVDSLIVYSFLVAVLASRLGHVFFYEPAYYLANPSKILKVWEGGVASHGAVFGLILFFIYYCKKKRWNFLWLLDRVTIPGALAAAMIRIGNLMNSEIYGRDTEMSWGFIFVNKGETVPKHPTQIYEAIAYLIVFVVLILIYRKFKTKAPVGLLTSWFLILLFGFRFIIEFVKEVQVDFEASMPINMGQILSIPFVIAGIVLLMNLRRVQPSKKK